MSPFVVIAALKIFLNMGLSKFGGKVNLFLNINLLFIVILLPIVSFVVKESKIDEYVKCMKKK